jgi:DNA-binding NarL/FixJ family response regulator
MESLTSREVEVVSLVVRGLPNKLVAHELGITAGTIKAHLHRVYQKLGVSSRIELILRGKSVD